MTASEDNSTKSLGSELASIVRQTLQVWKLISTRRRLALVAATLSMAIGAWFNARIPIVLGNLATSMELAKKAEAVWDISRAKPFLVSLALFFLIREGLKVLCKYLIHQTCTRVEKETSVALVSHLLQIDLATLSQERIGTLHGRIRRSIEGFVKLLKLSFIDFIPAFLTVAFALAVAFHRQKTLGLLMAGMVPIAVFIVMWQIKSQKGIRLELHRSKDSVDGTVVEQLGGIEYVRAAHTHRQEVDRVEQVTETVREKELKHHVAMSLYDCGKALNEGFFFLLVVSFSIAFAANGRIPVGDIVTYAMLFGSVLVPLREVHRILDEAHESALKVSDLMSLMSEPKDRSFAAISAEEPRLVDEVPTISMTDLKVSYPIAGSVSRPSLDGVSIAIRCGETIGVAGRSGSGKSTWLRALLRLVHPNAGQIWIGGVPIESVSRETIGRLIGYVGQTPFLFTGTVAENIAYGCEGASIDGIRRAAQMACIHEEIMAMPNGYQSKVAERGQNLSGGQRQRLALARVFLKKPPILILDEATSALDNISERRVQEALTATLADRTVIMVAHRLSTLREADRILVFEQGQIVEAGAYDELLDHDGVFAELSRTTTEVTHDLSSACGQQRSPNQPAPTIRPKPPHRSSQTNASSLRPRP